MKIQVVMMPADPARKAYVTNIEDSLKNMQRIVGGLIEPVRITEDAAVIVNEEGRINGMPVNMNCPLHYIFGDAFLVGVKGEEFCSVSDDIKRFWLDQCRRVRE